MRYLKSFNESFGLDASIVSSVKDIFVEYQDSHDLDIQVDKGNLPVTVAGLDSDIIEVKLYSKRGIRFNTISEEFGMLIDYMKSLSSNNEVKIYYDIDKSGLRNWRPFDDDDDEFDYYLRWNKNLIFNTIRIYFVESVAKANESFITETHYKDKIVSDITDMFIELKDTGLPYLVSMRDNNTVDISIYKKKKDVAFDLDLVRDCVEMTKNYLSDLGDLTEFYRFGYRYEWVTTRMTNSGPVDDKSSSRDNIVYSSFPDNWSEDVENKHVLEHRFDYELEGIYIVFKNI